jgi:hypothetical protein
MQQALDGDHLKMVVVSVGDQMAFDIHPELAADPQHAGNIGAVQVHVQQPHLIASFSQPQGQVNGHAGLTHAALAAHHQKFVPDVLELFLKTGLVFPFQVMVLAGAHNAVVALTGTHIKPLLFEEPLLLLIKYHAKTAIEQESSLLKDVIALREHNEP